MGSRADGSPPGRGSGRGLSVDARSRTYPTAGRTVRMSLAIAHFAVGVACTALLLAVVAPRLLRSPTLLVCGGIWAMVPDSYRVLPVGGDAVDAVHDSVLANAFWFHGALDRLDPTDSHAFAAALVGSMVVVVALSEWYARSTARVSRASATESLD